MTHKLESRFQSFHNKVIDHKARGVYPYFRKIEEERGAIVLINGKEKVMFGSNNYLSLAQHPQVKEAAIHAIKKIWQWLLRFTFFEWLPRFARRARISISTFFK